MKVVFLYFVLILSVTGLAQNSLNLEALEQKVQKLMQDSSNKKKFQRKNLLMASTPVEEDILFIGKEAPHFVLPDLNRNYVFLRYYCGKQLKKSYTLKNQKKKVVVLSFFASWCKPCQKELPYIQKISTAFKEKDVQFFLINVGENRKSAKLFVQKLDVHLPVLLDTYKKVSESYKVATLPRLVLLDKNGIVRGYKIGFVENENFEERLAMAITVLLNEQFYK